MYERAEVTTIPGRGNDFLAYAAVYARGRHHIENTGSALNSQNFRTACNPAQTAMSSMDISYSMFLGVPLFVPEMAILLHFEDFDEILL